MGWIGYMR
jgi:hypothetical protein